MNTFRTSREASPEQKALLEKMLGEVRKDGIRAVTFKMKDTLVLLPFSEKSDIFILMEDDFEKLASSKKTFAQLRTEAQEAAEKKAGTKGCVTLAMIYDILEKTAKLSHDSRTKLEERECELVMYFSFPRQCGKELFREAKKNRRKTVIIAETVYPRSVIVNILETCGYSAYDQLVIPAESNIPDGDFHAVFSAAVKKASVSASKVLHIGGSVERDVEAAILKGSKALLLPPVIPQMIKSGRLRGYIQKNKLYEYDDEDHLVLRCIFGLYAAYAFDIPQSKTPKSDFCSDARMLGFIVLGSLGMMTDFSPADPMQNVLLDALCRQPEVCAGRDDFSSLFEAVFADHLRKYAAKGCELPLDFYETSAYPADRGFLEGLIPEKTMKNWTKGIKEPEIAPVYAEKAKQNAASKLADKLFPPGTRVRTLVDDILAKSRK